MKSFVIGSFAVVFVSTLSMLYRQAEGLECYECLSLECSSGAVCASIRKTMQQIFVPKSHVIHFDPHDYCPESEDPTTSPKWNNLTKECKRSDSVCLVSPIEVITVLDGSKDGNNLDPETRLTTHGLLRGCASRRKLLESDPTIRVKVNLMRSNLNPNSTSDDTGRGQTEVYNMINSSESNANLSRMKFDDGYVITKVYSYEFFIDQWTDQATRCIQDNCNTKVKAKSGAQLESASSVKLVIVTITLTFLSNILISAQERQSYRFIAAT